MIRAYCLLLTSAVALSACTTTTSFAPPPIAINYTGETNVASACPAGGRSRSAVTVARNVAGTFTLIDTFVAAIRCSAHASANGRQAFEIPAFLATTGAALAGALGGGATYGILGTGASSAFNAGKGYWDPKAKAAVYDHALDAMLCIKSEAVGIPAYKFDNAVVEQDLMGKALSAVGGKARGAGVTVSADEQYFMMVSAAAFSVERVLAQRLSNMGTIDASAIAAELTLAGQEARKKDLEREAANKAAEQATPPAGGGEKALWEALGAQRRAAPKQEDVRLDLAVLKPKLDECVVRAKM